MAGHEHEWSVISYAVLVDGEADYESPVLWACHGVTSRGDRCIATATVDTMVIEERQLAKRRAQTEREHEQRHTNL